MFEKLVIQLLNKYLGGFVQDLDPEKINLGFSNGKIELFNLKLKPEALQQLDLPIEIKVGTIGYVKIVIPWRNFSDKPLVITVDNVLAIAGSIKNRPYNENDERQKRSYQKNEVLDLFKNISDGKENRGGFLEKSWLSAIDNVQVCITNVHVCYEETNDFTNEPSYIWGILLHKATVETTNNKWRSGHISSNQSSVFKLIKLDSFSIYWNPKHSRKYLNEICEIDDNWKTLLFKTLETFTVNGEECQFLIRPVSLKVKTIISKAKEQKIAKILLDFVLHDISAQLNQQQYTSIISFCDALKRLKISLPYRKYFPNLPLKGNIKRWWKYAFDSVKFINRSFSWNQIKSHRDNYRAYKSCYFEMLNQSSETIRADLSKREDQLDILNIILAREEAKWLYLRKVKTNDISPESEKSWWKEKWKETFKKEVYIIQENQPLIVNGKESRKQKSQNEVIEKQPHCIDHKVIFTVANCSFSLFNFTNQEIIAATFTHLLINLDTRGTEIQSFSMRLESILIEGITPEQELVPIVQVDKYLNGTGAASSHVFALDFGVRHPHQLNSDYAINVASERFEILYQQSVLSELKSFFSTCQWQTDLDFKGVFQNVRNWKNCGPKLFGLFSLPQDKKIFVTCYIKCPTIVIPEFGTIQKDGSLLIVDFGHLGIQFLLNPTLISGNLLKSAEKLVDSNAAAMQNLEILFNDIQILFVDSGDEWRIGRMQTDTDFHLIPKIHIQILCPLIGRLDNKHSKFNIALPSFKINLSDRRLKQLLKFARQLYPPDNHIQVFMPVILMPDQLWEPKVADLKTIVKRFAFFLEEINGDNKSVVKEANKDILVKMKSVDEDKNSASKTVKSDNPTEVKEQWARTIDLPGFEDNVSPTNYLTFAVCLIIGEVVIHMARSSDLLDKPYLMLRLEKLALDFALMNFGPALQLSAGCVQVVDKLHIGSSGEYLELLTSETAASENIFIILYRKVSSNCPDFKSHFHSVEQSLVITLNQLKTTFHQGAIVTVQNYLEYLVDGLNLKDTKKSTLLEIALLRHSQTWLNKIFRTSVSDPPVPTGATKYSISFRLDRLNIKLCDSEISIADVELTGLEMDFLHKANERKVYHMFLQYVAVTDLSETTLYSKIIAPDDDKVFEMKFIQNCDIPCQHVLVEDTSKKKCDMHLKIRMKKLKICLLFKFLSDVTEFLELFFHYQMEKVQLKILTLKNKVGAIIKSGSVVNLSIDIQAPLLIIPQKQDSPNAIVFQMGDIGLENYVKRLNNQDGNHFEDNILVRWNNLQMSRVIVMEDGTFEDTETILERAKIRIDIVREIMQNMREHLISISGVMDTIKMNIGHRELALILAIYKESNVVDERPESTSSSDSVSPTHSIAASDVVGKKLQAFFNTSVDIVKETNFHFILEGAEIIFGNDKSKHKVSADHTCFLSVTSLQLGEANVNVDIYNNGYLEMKCSLQSICLEDIKRRTNLANAKVLHSCGSGTSDDVPPLIRIGYTQEQSGNVQVNVSVEKIRLNLSFPYIFALTEFVYQAWLYEQTYNAKTIECFNNKSLLKAAMMLTKRIVKYPKQIGADSATVYPCSMKSFEEPSHWTINAAFKDPEIVFQVDSMNAISQFIFIKTNITLNKSIDAKKRALLLSVTKTQLATFTNSKNSQSTMILLPCNLEFFKEHNLVASTTNFRFILSPVDVRFSPTVVHIASDIANVVNNISKMQTSKRAEKVFRSQETKDIKDLWEIRKITLDRLHDIKDKYSNSRLYQKKNQESLNIDLSSIKITFESDLPEGRLPSLICKFSVNVDAHDWSKQLYLKGKLQMEASCFNCETLKWESLLEPVMESEGNYRPCEILFKSFRQTAFPVTCNDVDYILSSGSHLAFRSMTILESSSSDDTNSDDAMTIIRKPCNSKYKIYPRQKECVRSTNESGSDNEVEVMDKLVTAFGHMFSSESSDDQFSEHEGHVDINSSPEDEDVHSSDTPCSMRSTSTLAENRSYMSRQRSEDSADSGVDDMSSHLASYVIIDIKNKMDFTITTNTSRVINGILESLKSKPGLGIGNSTPDKSVQLYNKIGFNSLITVLHNSGEKTGNVLTVVSDKDSDFRLSPASTAPEIDLSPTDGDIDEERDYDNSFNFVPKIPEDKVDAFNYGETDVPTFYQNMTKEKIQIDVEGFEMLQCYLPERSSTRIFTLHPQKNETIYHLSVHVEMHQGFKTVHVASPLQIKNCLEQAVNLYYIKDILESLELSPISHLKNPFGEYNWLATVQPDDVYNVPLYAAYHCPIFFQPAYLGYQVSENSVWWQDLSTSASTARFITCPSKASGRPGYSFKAWCKELAPLKSSIEMQKVIPNFTISLHPSVTFCNYLSVTISLSSPTFEKDIKLEPGALMPTVLIDLLRGQKIVLEIANYNGITWKGAVEIHEAMEHNKAVCLLGDFPTCVKQHRQLYLDLKVINTETMYIYIYVPYWIINKTNLPLQFRGSGCNLIYESNATEDPVLFRYKHHRRRRCKTRVYNSRWSVSYSIDNVGNSGLVMCKDTERNKKYKFLLNIQLSQTQFTKIITLKPYFVVVNLTRHHLRFLERNDKTDLWMDIGPNDSVPIWPESKSMQLHIKIRDSKIVSQPFFINRVDNTVLRMDHGTALCVDVTGGQQTPWMVIFKPYVPGSAPVRVENRCDDIFLKFHQKSMCQVTLLSPYESILYTWDDPTKERTVFWNICNRKKTGFVACISKDGFGQETVSFNSIRSGLISRQASVRRKSCAYRFHQSSSDDDSDIADKNATVPLNKKVRSDKVIVYWVSYLEKNQRVLVFTQDENIARQTKKRISGSHSRLEWCLSIHDLGLSLIGVNNKEIAYISLTGAPSVWDVEIKHKWKTLPLELSAWLEIEWHKEQSQAEMTDYVQVDFNKMQMTKPFYGRLRRRYFPSIWCQYRCSEYLAFAHLKIHRLQIDNQLQNAVKPSVFYPAPIASQIVSKIGLHPFIELSFVQRHDPKQTIKVIKYFKLLIQECNVNVDSEFLETLSNTFKAMLPTEKEIHDGKQQLHKDLTVVQSPIVSSKIFMQNDIQKSCMFEYIHISPIKINLSFYPHKTFHLTRHLYRKPKPNTLDFILSNIGTSLSEMKDIELRLVFFERKGVKCPPSELFNKIKSHYLSQALLHSYVYVLGVDVLGNPYVFPRDFTQDLGDQYYEPSLGIVRLAEEYAESTAIEIQRLLGHYITRNRKLSFLLSGYLEQAESFLSFREEYKLKQNRNENYIFPESLISAHKTLAVGVVMGLSGVNVKPVHGYHQSGTESYLKGIGKGLLGIINKLGESDCDKLEIAFDGIRRAEEFGEDIVCRMRLPRFINSYEGVIPYSSYKAAGQRLVWKLAKGHYAESDKYWAHASMTNYDQSRVILLTDRHIFELMRNRVWVDWNIAWKMNIDDIMTIPAVVGNRLVIKIRTDKKLDLFPGDERYIVCEDIKILHWLKEKLEKVLIAHMEDQACPTGI